MKPNKERERGKGYLKYISGNDITSLKTTKLQGFIGIISLEKI